MLYIVVSCRRFLSLSRVLPTIQAGKDQGKSLKKDKERDSESLVNKAQVLELKMA